MQHNIFKNAIDNTVPFSNAFPYARFTLVNETLK